MDWYYVLLIIVGVILICYLILTWIVFYKLFKPGTDKPLDQVDLTNTHYEPYIDLLLDNMNYMYDLGFEELHINSDGLRLYGRYFDNKSNKTAIMVHGYRANPYSNFSYSGRKLIEEGYNVLFIYNRAHDMSEGKYITFGYKEQGDLANWINYINDKYNPESIILYGTSMGAATVIECAALHEFKNIKGIIADCGFLSSNQAISCIFKAIHYPSFMIMPLIRLYARMCGFSLKNNSPVSLIDRVNKPIIFIHSKLDKATNYKDSEYLYNNANSPKLLILSEHGGHTTGFMTSSEEDQKRIIKFINDYMK